MKKLYKINSVKDVKSKKGILFNKYCPNLHTKGIGRGYGKHKPLGHIHRTNKYLLFHIQAFSNLLSILYLYIKNIVLILLQYRFLLENSLSY